VHPPPDFDRERLGIHDAVSIADGSGRGADFPVPIEGGIDMAKCCRRTSGPADR
jgi:hypothetical protein